ncbi:MAG TPA: phospholipase D-like domain-containing protein, partial [Cytophagaceae bacterium]
TDALLRLLKQAKHSIDIQSPYLVTTELSRNAFKEAVLRGVKVRILTNSLASTDNLEAFSGYKRDRKKILETGVRIFEFRPDASNRYKIMTGELQQTLNFAPIFGLHAKSMVIDGETAVVGTFNLDPRSANLNTECITVIRSAKITALVQRQMEDDFLPENAWETTLMFCPDKEASVKKQVGSSIRKVVPKGIL